MMVTELSKPAGVRGTNDTCDAVTLGKPSETAKQ